jgi:predicted secreted protein
MLKRILITALVSLLVMQISFADDANAVVELTAVEATDEQNMVSAEAQPKLLTDITKPLVIEASKPEVKIRLSANPSTGYQWFIADYDQQFIKPKSYEYVPAEGHMVGASGVGVWTFEINNEAFLVPHSFKLLFEHRRPFEAEAVKPKIVTIVTVPKPV